MAHGRGRGDKKFLMSKSPKKRSASHQEAVDNSKDRGPATQGLGSGGRSGGTKSSGGHPGNKSGGGVGRGGKNSGGGSR